MKVKTYSIHIKCLICLYCSHQVFTRLEKLFYSSFKDDAVKKKNGILFSDILLDFANRKNCTQTLPTSN